MTKDHDFKALVRERMARTGESYTAARRHLLAPCAGDVDGDDPAGGSRTFSLTQGHSALAAVESGSKRAMTLLEHGGATIDADSATLRVWMGADPPAFDLSVPLTSITSAERLPDGASGQSLGVHGIFGRWLVNAAHTGLVVLRFRPAARAVLAMGESLDHAGIEVPRLLKPLVRGRTTRVRQLTVSVDAPEEFVAAIRSGRQAWSPRPTD